MYKNKSYLNRVISIQMRHLLFLILAGTFCHGQDLGYVLETTLLTCTDFSLKHYDSPDTKINDLRECLIQGNVLKVPDTSGLLNATQYYHLSLLNYEKIKEEVTHHEMENRREIRSLQRELVTLKMRLQYFSSAFNVPDFARLSDGRRLMAIRVHVRNLKDTQSFVETVHPTLAAATSLLGNLTSIIDQLDAKDAERAATRIVMEEAVQQFRSSIRALYV